MLESALKTIFFIIVGFIVFFFFFRFLFTNSLNDEDSDSASRKPANDDNSLLNWKIAGGLLLCLNLVFVPLLYMHRLRFRISPLLSQNPWLIYPHILIIVATVFVFYFIWKKGKKEQKEQKEQGNQIKKQINIPKLVLQIIVFIWGLIYFFSHYLKP